LDLTQELRYCFRSLARRRAYPAVVVLTLALGIGSATAIYSVVWWQLFRKAPAPPGVFMIGSRQKDAPGGGSPFVPSLLVAAYTAPSGTIEQCALATGRSQNVVIDKTPVSPYVEVVSSGLFEMLGITPAMGRLFLPGEYTEGKDAVAVVTYGFWKQYLGGNPNILGRKIRIGNDLCEVIGVLRQGQRFSAYTSAPLFRPFTYRYDPKEPFSIWPTVYAKLRPGVTRLQAQAALEALQPDVPESAGPYLKSSKPMLLTIADAEKLFGGQAYWTLVGAVGFLYLIACLNANNLMLGQLLSRRRELAVRLALGGSRAAVVRLVILESVFLSLAGTLGGALLANWLTPLFFMLAGQNDSDFKLFAWHLGAGTYAVLAGLTAVTILATSVAPALLMARSRVQDGLRAAVGAGGESRPLRFLRDGFVVLQAALAVVLLVGAGLMIHSFQRIEHIRLGFDQTHRVRVRFSMADDPKAKVHRTNEQILVTLENLREVVGRVPGALAVAYSSTTLLAGYDNITNQVKAPDGTDLKVADVYASSGFAKAGGLSLLKGRWFAEGTTTDIVINETLARKLFADKDPIGQYIVPTGADKAVKGQQVVGVVADVREKIHEAPSPVIYYPVKPNPWAANALLAQFRQEPDAALMTKIREAVFANDPGVVVFAVEPMDKALSQVTYQEHLSLSVFRVLSGIALALTLIGLYSIIAYTVDRRMGEFGIRMAVGATPKDLISLILKRAALLTFSGVTIGVAGALALTRFVQALLFEAPPFDGAVIGTTALLLLLPGLLSCVPPALRASRPDLTALLKRVD
jgi:putative ABC transport system permease protein